MAIRDIVSRGYGNGTYNPGVSKLPTRGYTIASPPEHITATNFTFSLPAASSITLSVAQATSITLSLPSATSISFE